MNSLILPITGLVNSLRKVNGNRIGLVIVDDSRAANFSPEKVLYKQQLQKTLTFNILKKVNLRLLVLETVKN